ncbi:MAG: competence/damage-inducible protein A [Halobaculum sp.]
MNVGILTVGDELLAGETANTNATWIAERLTERGATVRRILVVPDEPDLIADTVAAWREQFDAVIVTGGLGGTHDDLTVPAVADALDREVTVHPEALTAVRETAAEFADDNPDLVDEYDLDFDAEAWAGLPEGARYVENPVGLAPGCVVDDVYVLPGIPAEMKGVFGNVADEFGGDRVSRSFRTPAPEGALTETLAEVREEFDVAVGSYPSPGDGRGRVRVSGADPAAVDAATAWLRERIETVDDDR